MLRMNNYTSSYVTYGPYSRKRMISLSLIHSTKISWILLLLCCFNLQRSVACNKRWWSHRVGGGRRRNDDDDEQRKNRPWKSIRAGATTTTIASSAANVAANPPPSFYYGRVALAGGLAGATGTVVLYPMDCAKTLRQSNPTQFSSVRAALWHLIRFSPSSSSAAAASSTSAVAAAAVSSGQWHIGRAYRGWLPAAIGAVPSSALYFGAYESSKRILQNRFGGGATGGHESSSKWWIHGLAAATGNTISSAIFVPKEVLKQQMQYATTRRATMSSSILPSSLNSFPQVFWNIVREKGIAGFYVGYQATLMRNIPSAMIRFVLYEELKKRWSGTIRTIPTTGGVRREESTISTNVPALCQTLRQKIPSPVGLFAAGAVAGAVASGIMTPVDVIKTRLATGTCPVGVQNCFHHILAEMGWRGLYVGAGSRMMWSGAFSAIGFGTFEIVKGALGVDQYHSPTHHHHHQDNVTIDVGAQSIRASNQQPFSKRRSHMFVKLLLNGNRRYDH